MMLFLAFRHTCFKSFTSTSIRLHECAIFNKILSYAYILVVNINHNNTILEKVGYRAQRICGCDGKDNLRKKFRRLSNPSHNWLILVASNSQFEAATGDCESIHELSSNGANFKLGMMYENSCSDGILSIVFYILGHCKFFREECITFRKCQKYCLKWHNYAVIKLFRIF